jgi:hypothetical protein
LAYLGIVLILAGILATYKTLKKPRRLIKWSMIMLIVMQGLSFIVFSGMVSKSIMFLWLLVGLSIGLIFGRSIKMHLKGKDIFYIQNSLFSLSYLVLLFLNQLILIMLKVYIPVMLIITAITIGMQVGFNSLLLFKGKKLKLTAAIIILLCSAYILTFGLSNNASAASDLSGKYKATRYHAVDVEAPQVYWSTMRNPNGTYGMKKADFIDKHLNTIQMAKNTTLIFNKSDDGKYSGEWHFASEVRKFDEVQVSKNRITATNILHDEFQAVFDVTIRNGKMTGTVHHYARADVGSGNKVDLVVKYEFTAEQTEGIITSPVTETAEQGENPVTEAPKNPLIPVPVPEDQAQAAAAASGILAGLSTLIGTFAAQFGNLASEAVNRTMPIVETVSNTLVNNAPNPNIQTTQVQPSPPEPPVMEKPPIGSRREDGKIFTKNHGWQNENYPEMNVRSIEGMIRKLDSDIQKYSQMGDNLRTEIAKDALKQKKRELRAWQEDTSIVKRVQLHREEDLNKIETEAWINRAKELEKAENIANTVSFTADIALAVATSGASTTLSSASRLMKGLAMAKDALGTGAEVVKDFQGEKGIVQIVSEQGSKRLISKAVSVEFDKAKIFNRIPRKATPKALKALWDAAETSGGSLVQKGFDDMGVTENFGKGIDKIISGGDKL